MSSDKFKLAMIMAFFIIVYVLGLATAQYHLFPYDQLRDIKRMIVDNTNVNASIKKEYKSSIYHKHKKTFFDVNVQYADIVMLGDSLTDNAEWNLLFPSVDIADYGIGGDSTYDILSRVDQVIDTKATRVFFMAGLNDLMEGRHKKEVILNIKKIVERLIESKIHVYIQSTLLIGENKPEINKIIIELNNELKLFANTNEKITFIDLNQKLDSKEFLNPDYSRNGKYLNGIGYKVWKEAISPYIL